MSADSKLFIRDGVNPFVVEQYLKSTFPKVDKIDSSFEDTCYWIVDDGENSRTVWMFIVSGADDNDFPETAIKGESCVISVKCNDSSVQFLKNIGQQFKHSWILENDCDDSITWKCLNQDHYSDETVKKVIEKLAEFIDFVNKSKENVTDDRLSEFNELSEDLSKHFKKLFKL